MNERVKAFTNLIITAVLTINAALVLAGKNPIPFDESAFTAVCTQSVAGAAILWSWWKNNNITDAAIEAQAIKDDNFDLEHDDEADEEDDAPMELTEEEVSKHDEA